VFNGFEDVNSGFDFFLGSTILFSQILNELTYVTKVIMYYVRDNKHQTRHTVKYDNHD